MFLQISPLIFALDLEKKINSNEKSVPWEIKRIPCIKETKLGEVDAQGVKELTHPKSQRYFASAME